jgi:hypothetical protein
VLLLGSVNLTSAAATFFTLTGYGSAIQGIGSSFADPTKGTTITHTGTGAAIQLGDAAAGAEGIRLKDLRLLGSANGSHGIKAWSLNAIFENIGQWVHGSNFLRTGTDY